MEVYEQDIGQQKLDEVVWTINTRRGVKFPEFITILIRAAYYIRKEILDDDKDD